MAPPVNTGNIPFWYDILVVFGWPREKMLALIGRQATVKEPEEELAAAGVPATGAVPGITTTTSTDVPPASGLAPEGGTT